MNYRDYLHDELKDATFKAEYQKALKDTKNMCELINLRKSFGLSQQQLSELCGINQTEISRYETGMRSPSIATVAQIADALNMELTLKFVAKKQ